MSLDKSNGGKGTIQRPNESNFGIRFINSANPMHKFGENSWKSAKDWRVGFTKGKSVFTLGRCVFKIIFLCENQNELDFYFKEETPKIV